MRPLTTCSVLVAALLAFGPAAALAKAAPKGKAAAKAATSKKKVPAPTVGSLAVKASVPRARVFLDDVEVGETPLKELRGLKPGQHILKVTRPGFAEYLETVKVDAGKSTSVLVELLALHGVLAVESSVTGSVATLDGKPLGPLPVAGKEIPPGEHVVRVSAPGFRDYEITIRSIPGEPVKVKATLEPKTESARNKPKAPDLTPVARPPLIPSEAETAQAETGPKPWYKSTWVWAIAGGAALAGAGATVAVLASRPSAPTDKDVCACGHGPDAVLHGLR